MIYSPYVPRKKKERGAGGCMALVAVAALVSTIVAAELTGHPISEALQNLYPPRAHVEEKTITDFVSWVLSPMQENDVLQPILQRTPTTQP